MVGCSGAHDGEQPPADADVQPADAGVACVANLSTNCMPLYAPPTFGTLYANLFHPTCAQGIGTCHTSDAQMGGLVFEDQATAYALLLGTQGGRARVLPGNPACSLLEERLESNDSHFRMPPGPTPLSEPARCAVAQWIAQGANP